MKRSIALVIISFFYLSCSPQRKSTYGLFNEIVKDEEYKKMEIYAWSFIPELTDSLKNDENFKYTIKEAKEENFDLYFKALKSTPLINWRNYNSFIKMSEAKNDNTLQISSPIFVKKNKEALVQIKTNYSNWFNVYVFKKNKWKLTYGFGTMKVKKKNDG